jgi:putative hydrolase
MQQMGAGPPVEPSIVELLDVDREYRERGAAGTLARIAPRRFNPRRESWLPVLHTEREGRQYTALFSNTARAHELGATDDWVVIYRDDHGGRGQWTVVTARRGPLVGRRVVRGRERECAPTCSSGVRTRMGDRDDSDPWLVDERRYPNAGSEQEKLRFLVRYALLAPSSHNAQPWLFRIGRLRGGDWPKSSSIDATIPRSTLARCCRAVGAGASFLRTRRPRDPHFGGCVGRLA